MLPINQVGGTVLTIWYNRVITITKTEKYTRVRMYI